LISKKKSTGFPKAVNPNMVAAAVELTGGVTAVSRLWFRGPNARLAD
jgi:hypothetical protein